MSYLLDFSQYMYVIHEGGSSDIRHVTCGVPHGSILGSHSFIAYDIRNPNADL